MKLTLLTVSLLLAASTAWQIDLRCPPPPQARHLQDAFDMLDQEYLTNMDTFDMETFNMKHLADQDSACCNLRGNNQHHEQQEHQDHHHNHRELQSAFQLKMFWQEGVCWQEEWIERKWCMSCQGTSCTSGKALWLQFCSVNDPIQRFTYIPVSGSGGGQIKTATANLCLERNSTNTFMLAGCKSVDLDKQIFIGLKTDGTTFELSPKGSADKCIVNDAHHPKAQEVMYTSTCLLARLFKTSKWTTYNGGSESSPLSASDKSTLRLKNTTKCSSLRPCEVCQGDCDSDDQCQGTSRCFQRNGDEQVPGCFGGFGTAGSDYCYEPLIGGNSTAKNTSTSMLTMRSSECSVSQPCDICQGDCDTDTECKGGMKCFQRTGMEAVPGCLGTGSSGRDYCYQPSSLATVSSAHTTVPVNSANMSSGNNKPALSLVGCSKDHPCNMCQGDCDSDDECAGALVCKLKDGPGSVDGCTGYDLSNSDYCVSI